MDKKALLDELKIDRDAPRRVGRPLKILIPLAIVGGLVVVAWAFGVPYFRGSQVIDVETATASSGVAAASSSAVLDATGYVVARRQATVSSKATGKVLEVLVEEGMTVEEGQLLANPRRQPAARPIGSARVSTRGGRDGPRRNQECHRASQAGFSNGLGISPNANWQARRSWIETASPWKGSKRGSNTRSGNWISLAGVSRCQRLMVEDMEIRAPFAGVVIAKAAQPGEMISPVSAGGGFTRTGICTIVDMDSLEVEVDVNEAYINRVRPGQPVTATLNAYPDVDIPAVVIATIPAADRSKATVRVRVGFKSRDARILPDMGVRVAFLGEEIEAGESPAAEPGVWVPRSAVAGSGADRHVWVVLDSGDGARFVERRSVVVGTAEGSRVRITDGLYGAERVVKSLDAALEQELRDGLRVGLAD